MSSTTDHEDKLIQLGGDVLRSVAPNMVMIWKQLGFPPAKMEERLRAAISHHKELWESMLEEEMTNKKKILATVDRLGRQYVNLCKELGCSVRDFGENTPLLEAEKLFNEAISGLNMEKEERMKAVRVLFKEEDQLCRRLCMDISPMNRDKIPTSDQFQALQDRIMNLKAEVAHRQSKYVTIRDSIRGAMQQLEMSARSSFEVDLFVNEPSCVSLSDKDMAKLKELQASLTSRLEHNQKKAQELREVIETLWERLNIEQDVRDMFLMENRGYAPSTIQALEREKGLLDELKRQNIEKFIQAVRTDLTGWWDRCYVSEAERQNFTPFYTETYSEELLELHEAQVEKYKKLHAQYKDIFVKIHHRENLWKRMEDIEQKSKDPARLFGNRGCALLQEEKERGRIVKELPRVEEQLFLMLTNYERERGQILLINGADYRLTVQKQWADHEKSKENEKLQKQRERAEKLVEEAKGGAKPNTPMKRRLGTTGLRTQLESPKAKQRKLLAPSTAPQQRTNRKILTEDRLNQIAGGSTGNPDVHDVSLMSTYSTFTNNLQKKGDANSTVVMMDNGKAAAASCATPTRTPYRRSPRLASRTPSVTPLSAAHKNHSMMLRRSKTEKSMLPPRTPSSARPLTPARSTPKLTLAVHPRPFLM